MEIEYIVDILEYFIFTIFIFIEFYCDWILFA